MVGMKRRHSFSVPSLPVSTIVTDTNGTTGHHKVHARDLDTGDAVLSSRMSNDADDTAKKPPSGPAHPLPPRNKPLRPSVPQSDPKSLCTESKHFLGGINLEHCNDLLSIPDPPSPSSQHARKQRARRKSSPMVLPVPFQKPKNALKDRTNARTEQSMDRSNIDNKRSGSLRKSLSHVPSSHETVETTRSPIEHDGDGVPVGSADASCTSVSVELQSLDPAVEDAKVEASLPSDPTKSPTSLHLCIDALDDEIPAARSTKSARRKRRETMFLPPMALSVSPNDDPDQASSSEGNEVDSPPLDDEKKRVGSSLRRRKRQSIVFPSDSGDAGKYLEQLQECKAASDESEKASKVAADAGDADAGLVKTDNSLPYHLTPDEMGNVRSLVRQYCSLPISERDTSSQAEEIERMTGYALVPPAAKRRKLEGAARRASVLGDLDLNWSSSPNPEEQRRVTLATARRELLEQLGGLIELMDRKKLKDTEALRTMTGCRVERGRNGKYRYFHVATNQPFRPKDFQARYENMLEQTKPAIRERIQEWLKNYNGNDEPPVVSDGIDVVTSPSTVQDASRKPPAVQDEIDVSGILPSRTDSNTEPCRDEERIISTSGESMDISAGELHRSFDDHVEDETDTCWAGASLAASPAASTAQERADEYSNVDPPDELTVSIPAHRDEVSSDPDIAAAERRLWAAIDAALEEYSTDVLAIQGARRNGILAQSKS